MKRRHLDLALIVVAAATAACSDQPSRPTTQPQATQPKSTPADSNATSTRADETSTHTEPAPPPLDPDLVARNNHAVGLMGRFDFTAAATEFAALVQAHPDNADLVVNHAISVLNQNEPGKQEESLAILKTLLAKHAKSLRANYCAGLIELYLGFADEAFSHFQVVANADPDDAYAAYYVGQCLELQDKYADAATEYVRALELDHYLRSAHLGLQRSYARFGDDAKAEQSQKAFEELGANPRSKLAQFKYTRMGPKAMAMVLGEHVSPAPVPAPTGPLFEDAAPLLSNVHTDVQWRQPAPDETSSITAADIDADGLIDLFIANAIAAPADVHNAICFQQTDGSFTLNLAHPLAKIDAVNAALWGDIDNDGHLEVYLCRKGPNQLWTSSPSPPGRLARGGGNRSPSPSGRGVRGEGEVRDDHNLAWTDITTSSQTDNGSLNTVEGALADLDHDGDLDIFVVNADGPNELLNNNLDGTFRPIAKDAGLISSTAGSRQVVAADLDLDRDLDLLVINAEPPHDVFLNDRLWSYRAVSNFLPIQSTSLSALAIAATEGIGVDTLLAANTDGSCAVLRRTPQKAWSVANRWPGGVPSQRGTLALLAVSGANAPLAIYLTKSGWSGRSLTDLQSVQFQSNALVRAVAPLTLSNGAMAMVALDPQGAPIISRPGPGQAPATLISFQGRYEQGDLTPGQTMRSNASGVGTHYAARIGYRWIAGSTLRTSSGPGQSIQPVSIALDGAPHLDFVQIDWSDGVFQSEVQGVGDAGSPPRDFGATKRETIVETQRQISSCPVLFAHDGTRFNFVTDLLGVGGIGYMTAPHEYAPSRPWENIQLPPSSLAPHQGRYVVSLTEPMEEACYLDAARLVAYDVPQGWNLVLDERMNILGPEPTGQPRFYRDELLPFRASNDRNEDVTATILAADLVAAPVGEPDHRFIGRLANEHALTLEFSSPVGGAGVPPAHLGGAGLQPVMPESPSMGDSGMQTSPNTLLIIDGWIEYPYSQTMFAAWQAKADYRAPSLDARTASGEWITLLDQFGYPAGMPRRMSLPLPPLPEGCTALRLRTNQEIYWDRVAIAIAEPCPAAKRVELPLAAARCSFVGYPKRTTGPQRQPFYDYAQRTPFWDCRHQSGFYTAFGDCTPLIAATDDALAIFGPGEELRLEFDASIAPPASDITRVFILETNGWCKDMDLFTRDGETVEPLPTSGQPTAPREALHKKFNTRYESGN